MILLSLVVKRGRAGPVVVQPQLAALAPHVIAVVDRELAVGVVGLRRTGRLQMRVAVPLHVGVARCRHALAAGPRSEPGWG